MMYGADKADKALAKSMSGKKSKKKANDNPEKDHKKAMKKITANLKKASKLHAGQSKALAKASKMHGKQSAELAAASEMHARDAETMGKLTGRMKRTKNPGYKMDDY